MPSSSIWQTTTSSLEEHFVLGQDHQTQESTSICKHAAVWSLRVLHWGLVSFIASLSSVCFCKRTRNLLWKHCIFCILSPMSVAHETNKNCVISEHLFWCIEIIGKLWLWSTSWSTTLPYCWSATSKICHGWNENFLEKVNFKTVQLWENSSFSMNRLKCTTEPTQISTRLLAIVWDAKNLTSTCVGKKKCAFFLHHFVSKLIRGFISTYFLVLNFFGKLTSNIACFWNAV